jgi:HEAT repeat protein
MVAVAAVCPRVLAAQSDTRPATRPAEAGDYVARLARSLEEGPLGSRIEAAQRLAEINRPDARAAITGALNGLDQRAQVAAARAAADAPSPDTAWIAPLSALLDREQNPEYAGYAAQALARFDEQPRAYDPLTRAAQAHRVSQIPAIHALGRVVQKPVAAVLQAMMNDPNEPAAVHEAVLNALSQITPQTSRNEGIAAWTRWWNERSTLQDPAWRTRVVGELHRFSELSDARATEQIADLRRALYQVLYNQYEQQQANRKSDTLLGFLNNPLPEVRAVGAKIVPEAVASAVQFKADVKERLESLLGDASAEVRLNVAFALYNLSYTNAFKSIVLQLKVENDLRVKRAMVQALSRMDVQAIPVLEELLRDPSESVAATAAEALATLASSINLNAQDRQAIFDTVHKTLNDQTGPPGQPKPDASVDLRAGLVKDLGATADWSNPLETVQLFNDFLGAEPSAVRQAAVAALASAGINAGPTLSRRLNPNEENDPAVRREAALSLGAVKSFAWANNLERSSRAPTEPNPAVREAAWQSFQRVLPYGDPVDLLFWAGQFKARNEPDRRLVVQTAVCRMIKEPGSLAPELQTLGDINMNDLKRPADAILPYREALKIFQNQGNMQLGLLKSLLNAYLASNQIKEAIDFCRDQIQLDPRTKGPFGPALADTAEAWEDAKDPAKWERARALITQALTLDLDVSDKDRLTRDLNRIPAPPATRPTSMPAQAAR